MVKMLLLWFNHRRQVVGNYLIRRFYKASPDAVFGEEGASWGSFMFLAWSLGVKNPYI